MAAIALDQATAKDGKPMLDPCWIHATPSFVCYPIVGPMECRGDVDERVHQLTVLIAQADYALNATHQIFWCQAVFNDEFKAFISTFLAETPRWFDVHNPFPAEVLDKEAILAQKMFGVLDRLATVHESDSSFFTESVFGDILYQNWIFDAPSLIDICSVYGKHNSEDVASLVSRVLQAQPSYSSDLYLALQQFSTALNASLLRYSLDGVPDTIPLAPSEFPAVEGLVRTISVDTVADIAMFLLDSTETLNMLVNTLPEHMAPLVAKAKLTCVLMYVLDRLCGALMERFHLTATHETGLSLDEGSNKERAAALVLRSHQSALTCLRSLLSVCYVEPLFGLANSLTSDDDEQRTYEVLQESLFEAFDTLLEQPYLTAHVQENGLLADILDRLGSCNLDEFRLSYYVDPLTSSPTSSATSQAPTGHSTESSTLELSKPGTKSKGEGKAKTKRKSKASASQSSGNDAACSAPQAMMTEEEQLAETILVSNISAIKELMPDLGDGFIVACLDACGHKPEQVINRLFEDNLPPEVKSLPRDLPRKAAAPSAATATQTSASHEHSSRLVPDTQAQSALDDEDDEDSVDGDGGDSSFKSYVPANPDAGVEFVPLDRFDQGDAPMWFGKKPELSMMDMMASAESTTQDKAVRKRVLAQYQFERVDSGAAAEDADDSTHAVMASSSVGNAVSAGDGYFDPMTSQSIFPSEDSLMYEDEYDDTYDDVGGEGVLEPTLDEELDTEFGRNTNHMWKRGQVHRGGGSRGGDSKPTQQQSQQQQSQHTSPQFIDASDLGGSASTHAQGGGRGGGSSSGRGRGGRGRGGKGRGGGSDRSDDPDFKPLMSFVEAPKGKGGRNTGEEKAGQKEGAVSKTWLARRKKEGSKAKYGNHNRKAGAMKKQQRAGGIP
eukprot:m.360573 g.360573  ORF g.360573 m.360573 type:complete len:896 (-) comp19093_c0_seq1:269-2956(-)